MPEQLPLREAADRLGVSERTLRRRLKDGTITGQQISTAQGFRWIVDLPDAELMPAPQSQEWRQIVEERDAYRVLAEELRGELAGIRAALADLPEIRRLLEEAAATRQLVNAAPAGQIVPVKTPKRPHWWQRLFTGP
jgi:hypothetical protein